MAEKYNGAQMGSEFHFSPWGYGEPFGYSEEVDSSTIYNNKNYTVLPEENDPLSYGGNNSERGVDMENNVAVSIPTEKQIQNAAEMINNNDNIFPKWLAVKDMYSSAGQSLITSAATFFHNKPNIQSTSLISNAVNIITNINK